MILVVLPNLTKIGITRDTAQLQYCSHVYLMSLLCVSQTLLKFLKIVNMVKVAPATLLSWTNTKVVICSDFYWKAFHKLWLQMRVDQLLESCRCLWPNFFFFLNDCSTQVDVLVIAACVNMNILIWILIRQSRIILKCMVAKESLTLLFNIILSMASGWREMLDSPWRS